MINITYTLFVKLLNKQLSIIILLGMQLGLKKTLYCIPVANWDTNYLMTFHKTLFRT